MKTKGASEVLRGSVSQRIAGRWYSLAAIYAGVIVIVFLAACAHEQKLDHAKRVVFETYKPNTTDDGVLCYSYSSVPVPVPPTGKTIYTNVYVYADRPAGSTVTVKPGPWSATLTYSCGAKSYSDTKSYTFNTSGATPKPTSPNPLAFAVKIPAGVMGSYHPSFTTKAEFSSPPGVPVPGTPCLQFMPK